MAGGNGWLACLCLAVWAVCDPSVLPVLRMAACLPLLLRHAAAPSLAARCLTCITCRPALLPLPCSVWDLRTGAVARSLESKGAVTSIEVTPCGRYIVTADGKQVRSKRLVGCMAHTCAPVLQGCWAHLAGHCRLAEPHCMEAATAAHHLAAY